MTPQVSKPLTITPQLDYHQHRVHVIKGRDNKLGNIPVDSSQSKSDLSKTAYVKTLPDQNTLHLGWANYGPRAASGPPSYYEFQLPCMLYVK